MTRRNQPSLSREEQGALRAVRVLVAGCGSIGGAPVVPLVRLGVERFVLCEPGDYELNNLNRQAADMGDIGRNKAEVQADRARAINPEVEALVEPDGVTEDNVDWLVGTTDVVIDGVDVTEPAGIAAKRALHQEAWRQRRLVISGLDLGGTQVVYAFDYRDGRTRPLNGRLDKVPGDLGALEFLTRLVSPLDVPRELLAYSEAMIRGQAGSPPQLAPTADQFGVLAAWMVLDFAAGRPVRKRVKVAIPDLVMPRRRRRRQRDRAPGRAGPGQDPAGNHAPPARGTGVMSRVVAPLPEMRAAAPELIGALEPVYIAETEAEREAVFSFRYSVYGAELGRKLGNADHGRQRVHDEEDDQPYTTLLFTDDGAGQLTGTARIRRWEPGRFPRRTGRRSRWNDSTGLREMPTAEIGRLMIEPGHRGQLGLVSMSCAVYQLCAGELAGRCRVHQLRRRPGAPLPAARLPHLRGPARAHRRRHRGAAGADPQ